MLVLGVLLKGLLIGFLIAAPVGPIGVLCIQRTLAKGRTYGLLSGLGAATADALYGCIAGFGLSAISTVLIAQHVWLRLVGGLFLCYLGIKTCLSRPAEQAAEATGNGLLRAYLSTVFLTLTNPATILSFTAVFAGLGIGATQLSYISAALLVGGVFSGSALWWCILSGGVSLFRTTFKVGKLRWINWMSGLILSAFGLLAMLSLLS